MVVTRKVFHGTHRGPMQGIPPTGRSIEILVIDIVRVADGKIAEHWNCVDHLGLLAQLVHSHSMVPGGLEVMSKTTRLTSGTSLTMRLDRRASRS